MFWKFPNLVTSHIDTLLEKEDVTLLELLDEDDVLQECKAQNKKLIDFLVTTESMEELVNLVTQEPTEEMDEKSRYKYPNTACELLTSDVSQINDKLASEESLLNKVYSFLEAEGPLNPLLASFFSKVMGLLITRKSDTILEFLKSKEDFTGLLLHHMGTSAIMDLLLRIITCIENHIVRSSAISWLHDQGLVKRLVSMIDPSISEEKQCNASQSLCDIIRLNREQMSQMQDRWQESPETDPLLAAIESEEVITVLLGHMLDGEKKDTVIASGLAVIQTLLEFKKTGVMIDCGETTTLDTERLTTGAVNTLKALTPRLSDLNNLLLNPPKQHYTAMPTTIGMLDPPLGNTRLQIARLVGTLLITNTASVNEELARLGIMNTLLDLHFKYVWNNFLHTQVEMCIGTILNNSPTEVEGQTNNLLVDQLFSDYRIVQKILDYWEDNEQHQSRPGGHRRGYMGHLTKIANHITQSTVKGNNVDRIKELLKEPCDGDNLYERWDKFVSGTLSEVNKQNTVELVGSHPSSEDDDADFRDITFPADAAMQQQAFSDYQLQQMTSNFIDQFGFNEEEFAEQDERIDAPFNDKISSITFDINSSEDAPSSSLFEQACNDRMQHFDDADSDEDLWEEKEITFSQGANTQQSSTMQSSGVADSGGDSDDSEASTDSEEDLNSPPTIHQTPANTPTTARTEKMDIDSSDMAWTANFDENTNDVPVAMDTSPWSNSAQQMVTTTSDDSNWAKFNSTAPAALSNDTSSEVKDEWADFTQFTPLQPANLSSSDDIVRSSSPVAMDTAEVGSRPAAYLVKSAPADLATSIEATREELNKSPDSTNQDNNLSTPESSAASSSSVIEETTPSMEPTPMQTPGGEAEQAPPLSTTVTTTTNQTASPPSPAVDTTLPDSTSDTVMPPPVGATGAFGDDDEYDDDLDDNFDFLASSGLMKSADTEKRDEDPVDSSKAQEQARIEEIRAMAKDALEQFTEATQNGPV